MNQNQELSENLKITVKEIFDLKYANDGTIPNKPKYTTIESLEDIINILNCYNEDCGNEIKKTVVEEGTNLILKNFKHVFEQVSADGPEVMVYDFLRKMFDRTSHLEKQRYFHQLLDRYFEEHHHQLPTLTKELFGKLVKIFLPNIKMETLVLNLQKRIASSESALSQVMECILCPRLMREDCYVIVFNKIRTHSYELKSFKLNPLSEGFGFLGDHFILKIAIEHDGLDQELSFFAKFIPTTNKICETIALGAFKKEEFIYKQLKLVLKEFRISELLDFAPKCYFTRANDVIVLEDLNLLGLTFSDLTVPVTYEWMIMVTKQLGRFHACSFVLEEKLSKKIGNEIFLGDIFTDYFDETNFDKNNPNCWVMCFGANLISEYFIKELSDICKKLPVEDFQRKTKIEVDRMYENVKRSDKYNNVICHGDMWGANILSNKAMDCVLVDYQIMRYCPPAEDLLFMIYINSDRKLRLKHINDFIASYYTSLRRNLEMYNVDLDKFYTWDKFLESVNYFKTTGIIKALCYSQIMLCPREAIKEINSNEEMSRKFYSEDRRELHDAAWNYEPFRTRIRGLIEDLYEYCENNSCSK